ncbi:MAG: lamin tail domain-containing protein, partial [Myxococcales bacterium]|nr:lamin tail domain-containing protein [Myxococcales bacterium]
MKLDKTFTRWLLSALMMLVVSLSAQGVYAKCLTPPGDIDGSTKTNVNDVQCEILMTLWVLGGKVAPLPICLKAEVVDADINCDGALNVSDVQLVIQLALGAQLSPLIDGDGDGCADLCDFDTDGDGEPNLTDCSPFDPAIFPGAPEVCNGHDDDCDGARDEEVGVNAVKCSNDDVCDGVEICAGLPGSPGLVISELMINPAGPDAADDGFLEWIEIFNAGPTTIDLRNYVIKDNSGQFHQITAPNPVLAEAGGFAILARNGDYLANGGVYVDYVYSGFTMANTVDAVVLTNPVGVEVDRVEYNTALGWTIPNGASISVVNVAGNNNLAANWAASAAPWRPEVPANPPDPAIPASDLGTPGGPGVPPTLLCQDNPALVCTDGNACNGIETCHAVMGCQNGTPPNCDDGLACTTDSCSPGANDTHTCNNILTPDSCEIGGACIAGGTENPANQCEICNPAVNGTDWSPKSNGTACNNDSNGCTVGDSCQNGTCTTGATEDCDDGLTCTTDSCTSTGSGSFTCNNILGAGACLIGGACFADGAENPGNQCQICDDSVPDAWTNKANGTACNADSSGCTINDACSAGVCTAGSAAVCNDNLTCTTDSCVSTGNNTFTCDFDLNAGNCLIGGVCFAAGAENPDNQCQMCDATVPDAWTNKGNGTACNADDSGCTVDDACADGVCTAGSAAVCNDNLACTTDSCVSSGDNTFTCDFDLNAGNCLIDGGCFAAGAGNPNNQCELCDPGVIETSWTDLDDGTACNADNDGCTTNDACFLGNCTAGAAPNCNDNLACTTDSCNSTGDNTFVCVNDLDAGNCLIGGVCFADGAENPDNQCQMCDAATNTADWTDKSNGTACNADDSGCTVDDTCADGVCTAGSAAVCDDNLTCTTDSCVSTGDNTFTCDFDLDAGNCLIGDVCFADGAENPDNQCQICDAAVPDAWTDKSNGTACNADSSGCTVDDACADGVCTAGSAAVCNDNLTCTTDSCVSTGDNTFTCDFDLDAGNCLIGGVCFAAGAENPDNQCQMCDATVPDA